jgi:hypothetical protein
MKKFLNWIIAFVIAPIVVVLFVGTVWGVIKLMTWVNSLGGYTSEIFAAILIISLIAVIIKEADIPSAIIDWTTNKRRNQ